MTKCYPMKRLTSDRPVIRQHSGSTTASGWAIWTSLISSKTRRGAISLGLGTRVYPLSCSRQNTWVQNTKHKAGRTGRRVQVHLRDLHHHFYKPVSLGQSAVWQLSIRTVKLSLPKTTQTTAFTTKHAMAIVFSFDQVSRRTNSRALPTIGWTNEKVATRCCWVEHKVMAAWHRGCFGFILLRWEKREVVMSALMILAGYS